MRELLPADTKCE